MSGGNCMFMGSNVKAVSTLLIILLMIISAIVGGLLSYMFTIAFFTEIPKETTVTITDVYFDKENAGSFKISVLNPSFSPTNATITRIALSLNEEAQLYDVVGTEPSLEDGIVIPNGQVLNITCFKAHKDDVDVSWGKLAGEFAGENITVHVFSPDSLAGNIEASLPLVKLHIIDTDFDSEISFNRFNITIMNELHSEINLTVSEIMVAGIDLTKGDLSPELPQVVAGGEPVQFMCNKSWRNLLSTTLTIYTEEGYIFSEELELPRVFTEIQNVIFNENYTDHFNVTVSNLAESASYVNVANITCKLENGTIIQRDYLSVDMTPNSTCTFRFNWTWREYRGKKINATAYILQGLKTDIFTVTTPPPVIFTVLNRGEVFSLKDKKHFNITLENHPSSIHAVNITKIVADSEEIDGAKASPQLPYGPIEPGEAIRLYCNVTDWTDNAGEDFTLIVHAVAETLEQHTSEFTFTLPLAELNITSVVHTTIGNTKYLNITIRNLHYSACNLTLSKATVTLQNQYDELEQLFPENQIIIEPSGNAVLLCPFNWEKHLGHNIIVTVISGEGVEALWQGTDW
jgi:hypothetical protein